MENSTYVPRTSLKRWFPQWETACPGSLRLLTFPHAGGGGSLFRPFIEALSPHVAVTPVALPGRDCRRGEAAFRSLPALVDAVSSVLRDHGRGEPLALWGHSMGARIAFEVARALEREGGSLRLLIVSGCPAPQHQDPRPLLSTLPDPEFMKELGRLGGTPQSVLNDGALMELLLPTLRADYALSDGYAFQAGAKLSTPLAVWGGRQDGETTEAELEAWLEHSVSPTGVSWFDGGHFFPRTAGREVVATLERLIEVPPVSSTVMSRAREEKAS